METPAEFAELRAIPEKRILVQSNAITAFALGYQHTNDAKYLDGIREVDRFLREWLMAADGTFYTNQKEKPIGLPRRITTGSYWLLASDAERRKFGIPPIDHAVYTDRNGKVITAYVLAFEATGNYDYLATASKAATAILGKRLHGDGWVIQAQSSKESDGDSRMRPLVTEARPFLSAQAWFGTALLALYRATGEEHWLRAADGIGKATLAALQDDDVGGFFATVADATSTIIATRKPLEANGTAASFFYDLSVYTKDAAYAGIATKTIRSVAPRRDGSQ